MPTVRFVRMWDGFNPHDNPLLDVLRSTEVGSWRVETSMRKSVDLEMASVFPSRSRQVARLLSHGVKRSVLRNPVDLRQSLRDPGKSRNALAGIWYSGENQRPPASGWDGTLSFESSQWPNNAYLPYWQLHSDLFGSQSAGHLGEPLLIDSLLEPRQVDTSSRPGFCCAILRNPEPVRLRVLSELSKIGKVDVFGPITGRPVSTKAPVLRNYRFAMAFENDLYPGYVTEKPFDTWSAGTIPLYWGLDSAGTMDKGALVNLAAMELPEFLETIAALERDRSGIDEIASRPLLARRPEPKRVHEIIRGVLNRTQ